MIPMRVVDALRDVLNKAKKALLFKSSQITVPATSVFECAIEDTESKTVINLQEFPAGTEFFIETTGHKYRLVKTADKEYLISGHPEHCPEPVQASVSGSTWVPKGATLWMDRIGWGMHLEVGLSGGRTMWTGAVEAVRVKEPPL